MVSLDLKVRITGRRKDLRTSEEGHSRALTLGQPQSGVEGSGTLRLSRTPPYKTGQL